METKKRSALIRLCIATVAIAVAVSIALFARRLSIATSPPREQPAARARSNCGPDSLAVALSRLGIHAPIDQVRSQCNLTEEGASFDELTRVATERPVSVAQRVSRWEELRNHNGTCVLFVGRSHFVAVDPRHVPGHEDEVWVYDPNRGAEWMKGEELAAIWSGESLMLTKAETPAEGPRANLTTCWDDSGYLYAGSGTAAFRFPIENRGTSALTVDVSHVSCNCTTPSVSKTVLAPMEAAECTVDVKLAGKRGRFHEYVTLKTNDPRTPEILLNLTGGVYLDNLLSRDMLSFGEIDQGADTLDYVVVHDPGTGRLKVHEANVVLDTPMLADSVSFRCRILPVDGTDLLRKASSPRYPVQPGDIVVEVGMSVSPEAPVGPVKARLTIQTAYDDHRAQMPVTINAAIRSDLQATPKAIIFARTPNGKNSATVSIQRRSGKEVRIGKISITNDLPVKASIQSADNTTASISLDCDFERIAHLAENGELIVSMQGNSECRVPLVIRSGEPAEARPATPRASN